MTWQLAALVRWLVVSPVVSPVVTSGSARTDIETSWCRINMLIAQMIEYEHANLHAWKPHSQRNIRWPTVLSQSQAEFLATRERNDTKVRWESPVDHTGFFHLFRSSCINILPIPIHIQQICPVKPEASIFTVQCSGRRPRPPSVPRRHWGIAASPHHPRTP